MAPEAVYLLAGTCVTCGNTDICPVNLTTLTWQTICRYAYYFVMTFFCSRVRLLSSALDDLPKVKLPRDKSIFSYLHSSISGRMLQSESVLTDIG